MPGGQYKQLRLIQVQFIKGQCCINTELVYKYFDLIYELCSAELPQNSVFSLFKHLYYCFLSV